MATTSIRTIAKAKAELGATISAYVHAVSPHEVLAASINMDNAIDTLIRVAQATPKAPGDFPTVTA